VSEVGLGANRFGEPGGTDAAQSAAIVHAALDNGITFIDTSNVYAQGVSEEHIGAALKGRRHQAVIGTKFGSRRQPGPNLFGGSRKFVFNAIDASLRRLQTDYIDLYQVHRPDPRMPLEETLRTLDDLVTSGKVRYIGCCNFEAWRMVDGLGISRKLGITRFASSQFEYSILNRSSETEMSPACRRFGVGIIPYLPLAAGMLTGKALDGVAPRGSRLALEPGTAAKWMTPANRATAAALQEFASRQNHTLAELAIAWLLARPQVCSVITGATSTAQVRENSRAADWRLSPGEMTEIDAVLTRLPPTTREGYYSVAGYLMQ
jgi:aryl-alcohol dehydrogenase-like predicted oxidoreductase